MEAIILEYAWVLVVLIVLEGLLAADNAIVMAVMVKHLPEEQRKKALFYGLFGALVFRFAALFLIVFLAKYWQIQAIGALYLLFITVKHFWDKRKQDEDDDETEEGSSKAKKGSGFWMTVLKVELADIAFAVDSMLAAVAIAITLPHLGDFDIGGLNIGPFTVMFLGGFIGLVIMRFAANATVKLLHARPSLEDAAFLIVGWVSVKLAVLVFAHDSIGLIPHDFPHSIGWKVTFFVVLGLLVAGGWFLSPKAEETVTTDDGETKVVKDDSVEKAESIEPLETYAEVENEVFNDKDKDK